MDDRLRASLEEYDRQRYELILLTPDGYALLRREDETLLLQADGSTVLLPPLAASTSYAAESATGATRRPRRALVLSLVALVLVSLLAVFLLGLTVGRADPGLPSTPAATPVATPTPTPIPTPTLTPGPPATPTPVGTAPPARTGEITSGNIPEEGFGLFVFGGGSRAELVAASGCDPETAAFWTTNEAGELVPYIPAAPEFVSEEWQALFPHSIPPETPLLGRCR